MLNANILVYARLHFVKNSVFFSVVLHSVFVPFAVAPSTVQQNEQLLSWRDRE